VEADRDCPVCGDGFETVQRISEPALTECPSCEGSLQKIFRTAPHYVGEHRWNEKKLLSDGNLRKNGFKKLVKKSDGTYEDVLAKD
jgi:putative FmdB family regulatory protein